jgi:hypothetical protein
MGESDYENAMEMKLGGMIIFFSVFCVGIILLSVYIKLFKKFHSPSGHSYAAF